MPIDYGIWSLLPPALAIVLAIATRQVLISLLAGIWVGYTLVQHGNPLLGAIASLDACVDVFTDRGNTCVILFSALCARPPTFTRPIGRAVLPDYGVAGAVLGCVDGGSGNMARYSAASSNRPVAAYSLVRYMAAMTALRHTRRDFLRTVGAGTAVLALPPLLRGGESDGGGRRPNIVVIFTDDQGYTDVGVEGARGFQTPNLDRMASEGVRFTSFYTAQPVCSASRAALLTGCYPNRIGITGALGPWSNHGIHADEVTIAELCKSRGYATAVFGKWHLGHQPRFLPTRHGFDEFYGLPYSNDMWPLHPDYAKFPEGTERRKRGYPDLPLFEGEEVVNPKITGDDQARFTTQFTERAVDFIRRNRTRPFFLYLPHPMPHVPLFCAGRFRGKSEQGRYGDVIMEIDWSVGEILRTLEKCDLEQETLVIFTSDNGPWLSYGNHAGSAGPLREGKGTTWEGGVRVPCIMRWPGQLPAGHVCDEPVMTIDILPTIAGLIGAELPKHKIDGLDIWPLLSGHLGAKSPHKALCFYYHANDLEALRSGRWKLVFPHRYRSLTGTPGQNGQPGGYSRRECGLGLYDLKTDIGERHDVAAQHPEVVVRLQTLAEQVRDDLGDNLTDRKGKNVRPPGRV